MFSTHWNPSERRDGWELAGSTASCQTFTGPGICLNWWGMPQLCVRYGSALRWATSVSQASNQQREMCKWQTIRGIGNGHNKSPTVAIWRPQGQERAGWRTYFPPPEIDLCRIWAQWESEPGWLRNGSRRCTSAQLCLFSSWCFAGRSDPMGSHSSGRFQRRVRLWVWGLEQSSFHLSRRQKTTSLFHLWAT